MSEVYRHSMYVYWLVLSFFVLGALCEQPLHQCQDPARGVYRKMREKKFVLTSGVGAGMGNFLVFFPAAYYFAVLTGRELLIQDDSVIGEMCRVLHCGFPLFNEMAAVFPSVLNQEVLANVEGVKVGNFNAYLNGEQGMNTKVLRADGYKESSGWYASYPHAIDCISSLTGCAPEDFSCYDRHALQQLIRGPFKSAFSAEEEKKIIGVPPNFKHGLLTLPREFAPRIDAAVHLRCQFKHFEWLVGKEDTMWDAYVREVDEWLYSPDANKGQQLFRHIEEKIMAELHTIIAERRAADARRHRHRALLATHYLDTYRDAHRILSSSSSSPPHPHPHRDANFTQLQVDLAHEQEVYRGSEDRADRVYVYLAADNDRVKEAFAQYLLGHMNITVMRVHTGEIIVHAKNTGYLKQTIGGVTALVVDWYALSLANTLFAWRRDTDLTSTFARSALKVSGNAETLYRKVFTEKTDNTDTATGAAAATSSDSTPPRATEPAGVKLFQLTYRNNQPRWSEQ